MTSHVRPPGLSIDPLNRWVADVMCVSDCPTHGTSPDLACFPSECPRDPSKSTRARSSEPLEGTMSLILKRALAHAAAALAWVAFAAPAAQAAYISVDLVKAGGHTWDVGFTVEADPGQPVEAFTVYFDWTQVSNLQVWASPSDWDSLVVQADSALMSDAFFDTLALAGGVTQPTALGGFIARFDWADDKGPIGLRYTINDPVTFDPIERGSVNLAPGGGGTTVPEPATSLLLAVGAAAAASKRGHASSHR